MTVNHVPVNESFRVPEAKSQILISRSLDPAGQGSTRNPISIRSSEPPRAVMCTYSSTIPRSRKARLQFSEAAVIHRPDAA